MKSFKWLLMPRTVISAIILGCVIGVTNKELAETLAPIGDIYLSLLSMCILPLLMCAVASSLANLFRQDNAAQYVKKILITFALGLTATVIISAAIGAFVNTGGNLSPEDQKVIGKLITENDEVPVASENKSPIIDFLKMLIPTNILAAFTEGRSLSVLFFALLLGAALGLLRSKSSSTAILSLEGYYEALLTIINGLMYGLPFGLLGIFADQIATVGVDIIWTLIPFMGTVCIGSAVLLCLFVGIIKFSVNKPLMTVLRGIKAPVMVAFSTMSSFAAIPAALEALKQELGTDKDMTELLIPLGTCLNPIGTALLNSLTVVFMAQLYDVEMTFVNCAFVIVGTVFSSVAMSGIPGVGALMLLGIALRPLGLPVDPAVIISLAVLPVVEPIVTLVNVMGNMAVASILSRQVLGAEVVLERNEFAVIEDSAQLAAFPQATNH